MSMGWHDRCARQRSEGHYHKTFSISKSNFFFVKDQESGIWLSSWTTKRSIYFGKSSESRSFETFLEGLWSRFSFHPVGCHLTLHLGPTLPLFLFTLSSQPITGFPGGSVVKNPPVSAGKAGSIPGLGRSPGEGNGNPLQYSCLRNPMDKGAWWVTVYGVAKSQTQLNEWTMTTNQAIIKSCQSLLSRLCVCVLSHFSCVWLFVTLWTVARQTPLSMGFSRQE